MKHRQPDRNQFEASGIINMGTLSVSVVEKILHSQGLQWKRIKFNGFKEFDKLDIEKVLSLLSSEKSYILHGWNGLAEQAEIKSHYAVLRKGILITDTRPKGMKTIEKNIMPWNMPNIGRVFFCGQTRLRIYEVFSK